MRDQTIEPRLRAANPLSKRTLEALDLATGEAALGEALIGDSALAAEPSVSARAPRRRRSALLLLGGAAAAVAVAVVLLLSGGAGRSPEPAYGAQLVRFAESTPLLLLEAPGWHVQNVDQWTSGQGTMEFVWGKTGGREPVATTADDEGSAVASPAVRQRWVHLVWYSGKSAHQLMRAYLHPRIDRTPGRRLTTTIPALGAMVHIDTRAESAPQYGRPGDHEMAAIWRQDGQVLVLNGRVPDLAAFRERLDGLRRVDAQTWLGAMPPKVVKAADYGATVHQMLQGIPLPPGFDPASIPDLSLTTDRYQVGAAVGGAVACGWFNRWGEARADGDTAATQEAERVLLESEARWPIFRQMRTEGGYPATVIEYAEKMQSGRWYGKPLLAAVDSKVGLCGPGGLPGSGG